MPWQPIEHLAAAEQRLGTASAEFPYSLTHYLYRLLQCGGGVLLGLFFVFLAFQMTREGWTFPIVLMVIALGILTGCGYVIYRTLNWPHHRVKVFPAGLLNIKRKRFIVLYWGVVESVWEKITIHRDKNPFLPGRRTHVFTVQLKDGEKVVFTDNLHDVATLGEIIAAETARRLLPQALKKYNEGEVISFGNWSVSQAGLENGTKTLPWETIGKVQISNGIIAIKQHGKLLYAGLERAEEIPNLSVFLELIDALRGNTE